MNKNLLISIIFSILLFVWLASGCFFKKEAPIVNGDDKKLLNVRVVDLLAEEIEEEVVLSGKVEPARRVTLRAEIDARLTKTGVDRGYEVKEGDIVVELDPKDLPERLNEAKAQLKQKELEYEASKKLQEKNLRSESEAAQTLASLESARAQVESVSIDFKNTTIRAPFTGMLHDRYVEVGDYLSRGDEAATVIEIDPMIVVGYINERFAGQLQAGMPGKAQLVSGDTVMGYVRYISPESDPETRTFRVELEVNNPSHKLLGQTAQITLSLGRLEAHKISPALLSLNDKGDLGVKLVDEEDRVLFYPAKIVKSTHDALWLSGLPEKARLITVGQGFASEGEVVKITITQP